MLTHSWRHALALIPLVITTSLPLQAFADENWDQCLAELEATAVQSGVSLTTWREHIGGVTPQPALLDKLKSQPEFKLPTWDYLSSLVDDERLSDGQGAMQREATALQLAHERYGVDAATVAAVWGVESNFGRNTGAYPIVESLATLSCMGRRQAFFRKELFAALRIVQAGDFAPEVFKGSWAGAFGQTQFMPSTFERLAVDLNGDGKRDLIGDNADALGSTAHFLQRAGWNPKLPWGFEVKVPSAYQGPRGRKAKRPLADWERDGFTRMDGQTLRQSGLVGSTPAGLLEPEPGGPTFLVFRNFDALYSYNASENYALAIAHLSDRLRGGGPFLRPWPTDDAGLSRAQKREIQILLITRGHDIGSVDGALGPRSRAAIELEQARLGQAVTGRAGQLLLGALQRAE
jgi:lytic murein transglycosylase